MKLSLLSLVILLLVINCVASNGLHAQVSDDFEDGDLLNPVWFGDTKDFTVTDGRLRLMADGGGSSVLSIDLGSRGDGFPETFSLEFLAEMEFAPSASNYCIINLVDNVTDTRNFSGIFTRLGGISGDRDTWTGTGILGGDIIVGEFSGPDGALGQSPAAIRLRITYDNEAGWQLFADYTGGTDFVPQGSVFEHLQFSPRFLELRCFYTATRADKFSFDDLNAAYTYEVDSDPPAISGSSVVGPRRIDISYSEAVGPTEASDYSLSLPGVSVSSVTNSNNVASLDLSADPPIGTAFTVTATGVTDLAGNTAGPLMTTLSYDPVFPPDSETLLVTEFMADQTPVIGLPATEYVELYNAGATNLDLTNVRIGSGGAPVSLSGTLAANSYVVLADEENRPAFEALGTNFIGVDLPGLSNAGDNISLTVSGDTIFSIDYTDHWYNDPDRNNGGYSIEYTAFSGADAGCSGLWRASLDPSGGTPGRENSVINQPADTSPPVLTSTDITTTGVTVGFSEPLDTDGPDIFLTRGEAEVPLADISTPDGGLTFTLTFVGDLEPGVIYTLQIPATADCVGNSAPEQRIMIGIPDAVAPGDIVINEVLFNAASGAGEFVELYNCSEKIFQISGWVLSNNQSASASASREIEVSRLFLPGEFLVFTEDAEDLAARFTNVDRSLIVEQPTPSLSNDEGNITVTAGSAELDAFDYSEDLHSDLLRDPKGVSLERLRYKVATGAGGNWFSAASVEGGATPTRANSQLRDIDTGSGNEDGVFSLATKTFSPDSDGNEDLLEIRYNDAPAGSLARVRIFDAQGRPIRTLRSIELLGASGNLTWDGSDDDGQKAKAGAYLIFVELVSPDGPVVEEKLVAVLAGAL